MHTRIRARLLCTAVTPNGANEDVTLAGAEDGRENETFHTASEAAPTIAVTLTITNKAAKGTFVQGKRYTMEFAAVET